MKYMPREIEDIVHAVPKRDVIDHEVDLDGSCVCGPTPEIHQREGDSDLHRYVHHRLGIDVAAK